MAPGLGLDRQPALGDHRANRSKDVRWHLGLQGRVRPFMAEAGGDISTEGVYGLFDGQARHQRLQDRGDRVADLAHQPLAKVVETVLEFVDKTGRHRVGVPGRSGCRS